MKIMLIAIGILCLPVILFFMYRLTVTLYIFWVAFVTIIENQRLKAKNRKGQNDN